VPSCPVLMHTALDATDVRGLAEFYRELHRHRQRAETLGATLLLDREEDSGEPLFVLADPAGHPFCILVGSA
jgi:hypothetical protein